MGADYSATIIVGYVVDPNTFLNHLEEGRNKKTHKEKRYCQNTGKRLADVEVVDHENRMVWKFDGKDYEQSCLDDILEAIAAKFGCSIFLSGNLMCSDGLCCITSDKRCKNGNSGDSDSDDNVSFEYVDSVKKDLLRIGKALKKAGFPIGDVGIHSVLTCY